MIYRRIFSAAAAAATLAPFCALAGDLHHETLAGGAHVIMGGSGGNIVFTSGDDGVLVVDSGSHSDAAQIIRLIEAQTSGPLRYLINTHAHPQHTGGNARFAREGAVIVAHEKVRGVLAGNMRGADESALPVITLSELGTVNLQFNGESVSAFHVAPVHSPGNLVVHFPQSNVIHTGEIFSPQQYPTFAGGTVEAAIAALNRTVQLADFETQIVPSFGAVADRESLIAYREMLIAVRERVIEALDQGKTLEQFVASRPTAQFDPVYGDPSDPLFLPVIYEEMSLRRQ